MVGALVFWFSAQFQPSTRSPISFGTPGMSGASSTTASRTLALAVKAAAIFSFEKAIRPRLSPIRSRPSVAVTPLGVKAAPAAPMPSSVTCAWKNSSLPVAEKGVAVVGSFGEPSSVAVAVSRTSGVLLRLVTR